MTVATHRGAFVRQLDKQSLRELFELRTALELESAHRALAANDGKLPPAVDAGAAAKDPALRAPARTAVVPAVISRVGNDRWGVGITA